MATKRSHSYTYIDVMTYKRFLHYWTFLNLNLNLKNIWQQTNELGVPLALEPPMNTIIHEQVYEHMMCWFLGPYIWYHDDVIKWKHFLRYWPCVRGNSPVPGEFPAQRPVTRSFDVFFDLRLNKRLSKQSWGWWFETLSGPLWRHRNDMQVKNHGAEYPQAGHKTDI